ncbi:hypothetical protein C8R43DRAFT_1049178 [Mycena crocata]|nr:hypothetical protein C8R43DRAFT_1049178 [Mycena crocata]
MCHLLGRRFSAGLLLLNCLQFLRAMLAFGAYNLVATYLVHLSMAHSTSFHDFLELLLEHTLFCLVSRRNERDEFSQQFLAVLLRGLVLTWARVHRDQIVVVN